MTVWTDLARALSPVEERPRLAPHVETARFTTRAGEPYIVVHNPHAGSYARLDPREFELLDLMDGQHSIKELVVDYYRRHGVLALPRVAGLVRLLRNERLLDLPPKDAYALLNARLTGRTQQRRVRGELSTSSADGVLGACYRAWGHLFFHRVWLLVGVVAAVVGPPSVVLELLHGRYTTAPEGSAFALMLIVLALLTIVALAIHELGHGLAVKHAGRRVHRAGIRFYFGLPTAYVDTTDVWMAPLRHRLLTSFAGPWTGLVLGALCALGAVLAPDGLAGALLFAAALVFLVDNLFNFNPLLELDGYYMLVDLLDRPLLRPRALAFVRGPLFRKLRVREPLAPDERLYAWFGLLAVAYAVITVLLAVRAWQSLVLPVLAGAWASGDALARAGVVVVLAIFGLVLVGAAWRLLRWIVRPLRWLQGRATAQRHREALAALGAVPLWTDLPEARLLELARHMRAQDVEPGVEIVRQGDRGDRFFVIGRGMFEVIVSGRPSVLLGRGNYFGERALLQHVLRSATVVAVEAGRVYWIDQPTFDALLAHDLEVRDRIRARLAYHAELAEMPLFRDLSATELELLVARFSPLSFEEGSTIIRQGARGQRFYVVRSGAVEVWRNDERLARLGPGEAFGEIALLLDIPRTASVVAVEPTQLLALEADDFRDLLASYLGRAEELQLLTRTRLRSHM